MSDYLIGCDILGSDDYDVPVADDLAGFDVIGSDWGAPAVVLDDDSYGVPVVIDDPSWGVPVEVVGLFDMNTIAKQFSALKQVPVSVAQAMLKGGFAAINQAISTGNAKSLPGGTDRNMVLGKLQWHQAALQPFLLTPNVMYFSPDDLKTWVERAYEEANAAETGADFLNAAWDSMWKEITTAIAALPAEVRKDVANVVGNVTGLPLWAWGLIVLGALGAVVFVAIKLADTKLGAAVGGRLIP